MSGRILRAALLADGRAVDVTVADGRITSVDAVDSTVPTGDDDIDLDGRLLLPALGEPHVHLDKALTADVLSNPAGDLTGAIEAVRAGWAAISVEDVIERATEAARRLVASGTTVVRTHADVTPEGGLKSVEALLEVRRRVADLCDLEIVAMAFPVVGPDGDGVRLLLDRAMELGADVVGGVPHLESDPHEAIRHALHVAIATGARVDLHLDEVLDERVDDLSELARLVERHELQGRVTADHCVSHGLLPVARQREVAAMLADADIAVVTLPRTNLSLQARGRRVAVPRGLPGIESLLEAGVVVAGGGDNVQDPFSVVGCFDPLETAALLVTAAHRTVEEAMDMVGRDVRRVLGREAVTVEPGAPADLLAIRARSMREAIAERSRDRLVFRAGRLVARTTVERWVADPFSDARR